MKKFGSVVVTVEGVPTLNIPSTMHDAGLRRFKGRKKVKRFINKKTKQIMATKKKIAKAKKTTSVKRVSGSEKIRNLYDMHVKKLGFTETQKLIIKKGYNRNTVVPVLWKHRIALGEIDAPKTGGKKVVAKKKPAAKKKATSKKKAVAKKKVVKAVPVAHGTIETATL